MELSEAFRLGLDKYNTGRPCKNGHIADRFTKNRTCTQCNYEKVKAWVTENPDAHAAHGDRWRRKAQQRGYYQQEHVKERMRGYYRKKKGIPVAARPCPQHCENCGRNPGKRGMHLDHDHETGAFRGWLCGRCNMGLGALGDSIETIQRVLDYLKRA